MLGLKYAVRGKICIHFRREFYSKTTTYLPIYLLLVYLSHLFILESTLISIYMH